MLDHLSEGRFEFGTGRGAGSHEILGFLPEHRHRPHETREIWEDVDRRVPEDVDAGHLRGLRGQVLVAAAPQDPAQAVQEAAPADVVRRAATRRATRWRRARASACSASRSVDLDELEQAVAAVQGRRSPTPSRSARSSTTTSWCTIARRSSPRTASRPRRDARRRRAQLPAEQRVPLPRHVPAPRRGPDVARAAPRRTTDEMIDAWSTPARLVVGDPDDALAQCQRWEAAGADQLVFGIGPAPLEEHARDDPAHGRARDPQDRHRPGAPHGPDARSAAG